MTSQRHHTINDDEPESFPRTPDGHALPRPLDRDVTMALVQRYVATERQRARRTLFFLSGTFIFVMLLVLIGFITVGIVVLNRSRRASALAELARAQTEVYASETLEMSGKLGTLSQEQDMIRGEVEQVQEQRQQETAVFKGDLERFGQWMETKQARDRERVTALLESRLKELERAVAAKDAELTALRDNIRVAEPDQIVRPASDGPLRGSEPDQPELIADIAETDSMYEAMVGLVKEAEARWDEAPPVRPAAEPGTVAVVTFPNGDRYEGEFLDGLFHGWGLYRYANGDRYEGEFVKDMKHGRGVFVHANGDTYTGMFKHDMKAGRGRMAFASGDRYVGDFANDMMQGKGVMLYRNGNRYAGDFKTGLKHGNGAFSFANGDIYRGDFRNDLRQGRGVYVFSDGSKYIGDFHDGRRHGRGRYIYPDGSEYAGQFKAGQKHGRGEAIYPDGKRVQGLWTHDQFVKVLGET